MRIRPLGLLLLAFAASGRADAICASTGAEVTVLLRGAVLDCRSALPEIEAELEKQRGDYEERAAYYRNSPLSHVKNVTRPYDEHLVSHLSHVKGVIITFLIDGRALIPESAKESPAADWEDHSERRELFLQVGGNSCNLLPDPPPTVLVQESECCDMDPPSQDSCKLGLQPALFPDESLLQQVR